MSTVTTLKTYEVNPDDFKDVNGRWRTVSLFMETNRDESKYPSVFTLGSEDKDGRVSMQRLYMEAGDPTEFLVAKHVFGSFECWTNLCNSTFFKPHIKRWREELHRRIRSRSIQVVIDGAETGNINSTQLNAAKWLASQEWDGNKMKSTKKAPGRPPKVKDPELALRELMRGTEEEDEDFERLGLSDES